VASQGLWSHGPATFWVTLALYLLLRPASARSIGLAGLTLGLAVAARPTTFVFIVATVGCLAWRRRWNWGSLCALAAAVPVLALIGYNSWYFGAPLGGGYGAEAARWTHPFWQGFGSLLLNPSRGLFVYTPALLLLPVGLRAVSLRGRDDWHRALAFAWFGAALVTIGIYARWHVWWGGWSYGPRFLIETLPILCLLSAYAFEKCTSRLNRTAAGVLVGASIGISALGVFGEDDSGWNLRHPDGPETTLHDTQIGAAARHLLGLGEEGK